MRLIYHLVPRVLWEQRPAGPYSAANLADEGFIHCSNADQVERVANRFFAGEPELLALVIDAGRLTSPLRDEVIPTGEQFPHVYGPINADAVVDVRPLRRDEQGRWTF